MIISQKIFSVFTVFNNDYKKSLYVFLLAAFLVSCGSSTGTVNESTSVNNGQRVGKVTMFPAGFFDSGYIENYVITGTDDNGRQYTGTYEVLTGAREVFYGVTAIPVASTLSYTTIINGVQALPITIVLTQYYSADLPHQYLGNVNNKTSLVLTLQGAANNIPTTVASNASGSLSNLIGSDSSLETIDWSVSPAVNNTYNLVYAYNDTDGAGGLINNEIHTFVVNADGKRLSWKMVSKIPSLNSTLRFSGDRQ